MLGVALKVAVLATVSAWGASTLTDPATTSTGSDHTAVTIALITGAFTFLAALLAAVAQIMGPRLAQKHIEAAGEAVDVIVEKLVEAEEARKVEESRKESAIRHAARNRATVIALRDKAIAAGIDPATLPPVPDEVT